MKRIEGMQDEKIEVEIEPVNEDCPRCLDEKLVRLAGVSVSLVLVCPNCDLVVRK